MFKNYLKTAFRNLWRNRIHSGINILGLSIGIAAVIFILLYLHHEWSYDRFHQNVDNLYRISVLENWEGRESESQHFLPTVGPALKRDFPQVNEFLRLRSPRSEYFYHRDNPVKLEKIVCADSSFFELLSFKLLSGNPKTALTEPYSMVLTQSLAKQVFGTVDVIGKTLQSDKGGLYSISGVVRDPPPNSSILFDALISFSTLYMDPNMHMGWNGGNQYITYIRLNEDVDPVFFEKQLPNFIKKYLGEQTSIKHTLLLQPFKKIHLFYSEESIFELILLFGSIALLILVMASINFINLSLAQTMKRVKEIGIRKVLGAGKRSLVFQFLTESILIASSATFVSVLIVEILFPVYTKVIGQELPQLSLVNGAHIIGLLAIALIVGIAAGSLPAFHLASLLPEKILKSSILLGHRKVRFRNILLVFQFSISILLIFSTTIIYKQQVFIKNKALGFNKDNIVVINLTTEALKAKNQIIKSAVKNITSVRQASLSSRIPYHGFEANGYLPEGFNTWKIMHVVFADEDFLDIFDLQLLQGRNFIPEMKTDEEAYLINESLAKSLGWDEPLGKRIQRDGMHTVIGVVKDFHYTKMYDKIEPLIISNHLEYGGHDFLAIRVDGENISSTIKQIKEAVSGIVPSAPFEYWFLNDAIDSLYRMEERISQLFFAFSVVAIFVALLGLYSLVAIATEYKIKEIGIRKVLGSSVYSIMRIILKEFLSPIMIANFVALPIAWFAMQKLLQFFAYRIDISWWMFFLAGGLALLVALVTISWQAIRAATANPVESLRYE